VLRFQRPQTANRLSRLEGLDRTVVNRPSNQAWAFCSPDTPVSECNGVLHQSSKLNGPRCGLRSFMKADMAMFRQQPTEQLKSVVPKRISKDQCTQSGFSRRGMYSGRNLKRTRLCFSLASFVNSTLSS
jgi:hypothetical protein